MHRLRKGLPDGTPASISCVHCTERTKIQFARINARTAV